MRSRHWRLSSAALLIIALGIACTTSDNDAPLSNAAAPPAAAPPAARESALSVIAADLPALPPGIETAARPPEVVRAVYEFAARHPEVLDYVPCFCSCETRGHQNNHDCFVASRDTAGHVTRWESHGMICEVCIDVARQAMQMHNSGASTAAIRDAIERRFGPTGAGHTHTPPAPSKD